MVIIAYMLKMNAKIVKACRDTMHTAGIYMISPGGIFFNAKSSIGQVQHMGPSVAIGYL